MDSSNRHLYSLLQYPITVCRELRYACDGNCILVKGIVFGLINVQFTGVEHCFTNLPGAVLFKTNQRVLYSTKGHFEVPHPKRKTVGKDTKLKENPEDHNRQVQETDSNLTCTYTNL